MSTFILRPNSDEVIEKWLTIPGQPVWSLVDDVVADDDATKTESFGSTAKAEFGLTEPPGFIGIVEKVEVSARVAMTDFASGQYQILLRLGASSVFSSTIAAFPSYVTTTREIAKPGGGTWTVSDFQALNAGVWAFNQNPPSESHKFTQLFVTVTFEGGAPVEPFDSSMRTGDARVGRDRVGKSQARWLAWHRSARRLYARRRLGVSRFFSSGEVKTKNILPAIEMPPVDAITYKARRGVGFRAKDDLD